jgi:hypothetical protein
MEEPICIPCITFFSEDAPSQDDIKSAIKELEKGIRKRKMYIPKEHRLGKGTIETRAEPDRK